MQDIDDLHAEMRAGWAASEGYATEDVLTPQSTGIRFESPAVPEHALGNPFPVVRWTDRWGRGGSTSAAWYGGSGMTSRGSRSWSVVGPGDAHLVESGAERLGLSSGRRPGDEALFADDDFPEVLGLVRIGAVCGPADTEDNVGVGLPLVSWSRARSISAGSVTRVTA